MSTVLKTGISNCSYLDQTQELVTKQDVGSVATDDSFDDEELEESQRISRDEMQSKVLAILRQPFPYPSTSELVRKATQGSFDILDLFNVEEFKKHLINNHEKVFENLSS